MSRPPVTLAPLRAATRRLGWPGACGLLALALAGVLELGLAQRWEHEQQQLDAQALRLQAQLRRQRAAGAPAREATPEQWLQQLPAGAQRQQRLADLLELALRAGLGSSRTEHRLSLDAGTGLERLRVSMPVQGSYAQLRGFIEAALRADPALSLDGLKLRRADAAAAELEAELSWSLHGRAAAPVAGGRP